MPDQEPAEQPRPPRLSDFDRWVTEHDIAAADVPAAFAIWLREVSAWCGEMREVNP